jgi:hypothetical protein
MVSNPKSLAREKHTSDILQDKHRNVTVTLEDLYHCRHYSLWSQFYTVTLQGPVEHTGQRDVLLRRSELVHRSLNIHAHAYSTCSFRLRVTPRRQRNCLGYVCCESWTFWPVILADSTIRDRQLLDRLWNFRNTLQSTYCGQNRTTQAYLQHTIVLSKKQTFHIMQIVSLWRSPQKHDDSQILNDYMNTAHISATSCVLRQPRQLTKQHISSLTIPALTSQHTANDMPDVVTYVRLPQICDPTTKQHSNLSLRRKHYVMITYKESWDTASLHS